MFRQMLKSKIQRVRITDTKLDYEGSIGIDKKLLVEADILPGERVQVLNYNNGARFETYTIEEEKNSGRICLYGPAAKLGRAGNDVCVLSYVMADEKEAGDIKAKVVYADKNNKLKK